MDTFTFKPALLARHVTYRIAPTHVARLDRDGGDLWRVDYADLTELGYAMQRIAATRTERLDLYTPGGTRSLTFNASYRRASDPQLEGFRRALSALADALNAARPDLQVRIGTQGRQRIAMFAVAVVMLLCGLGLGTVILASGVAPDRLAEVAAPLIALIVIGTIFAVRYRPGKRLQQWPIAVFARIVQAAPPDHTPD